MQKKVNKKQKKKSRIFLRGLINNCQFSCHHHIHITSSVRLDLKMWSTLLSSWNGTFVILSHQLTSSFTDGFGAYFDGSCIFGFPKFLVIISPTLEIFAVYAAVFI